MSSIIISAAFLNHLFKSFERNSDQPSILGGMIPCSCTLVMATRIGEKISSTQGSMWTYQAVTSNAVWVHISLWVWNSGLKWPYIWWHAIAYISCVHASIGFQYTKTVVLSPCVVARFAFSVGFLKWIASQCWTFPFCSRLNSNCS